MVPWNRGPEASAVKSAARLAVDPIYFTFDRASGKLARIEGIVPTKVRTRGWRGERWSDFDARVEYAYVAETYR